MHVGFVAESAVAGVAGDLFAEVELNETRDELTSRRWGGVPFIWRRLGAIAKTAFNKVDRSAC
jgi:hypothetical protein